MNEKERSDLKGNKTKDSFEQDLRNIQDRFDGYVTDEVFVKYADKLWIVALDEIKILNKMLLTALTEPQEDEVICTCHKCEAKRIEKAIIKIQELRSEIIGK